MHKSVNNLLSIENTIKLKIKELNYQNYEPKIVAISKTFPIEHIFPLIKHGHIHFGENKVQEALSKWTDVKNDFAKIKLHMVGKLQTNKVKHAVSLFDYIHSLDNLKLAEKIANEEIKQKKKLNIFVQINIGREEQKNGISSDKLDDFYKVCVEKLNLNIIGLMCLPPNDNIVEKYFFEMLNLKKKLNFQSLSMGMSEDYLKAIEYKSNFLRIGSKIFGNRK